MSSLNARRLVLRNDLAELETTGQVDRGLVATWGISRQVVRHSTVPRRSGRQYHDVPRRNDDRVEIAVELEPNGDTLVARIEDTGPHFARCGAFPRCSLYAKPRIFAAHRRGS
jgi:hypothetical protein